MRIREGDPLEIFTDRDGEVIFKKYSPIGELLNIASQYAETLYKTGEIPIIITDRDTVVAYAGTSKKDCAEKKISPEVEAIIESRKLYTVDHSSKKPVIDGNEKLFISVCMPILSEGDMIGSVISVISEDSDHTPDETEIKLIETAAAFLSKQLEA
jgi:AbrB family transcriptional regulator (stage V sporulation protein T)